MTELTKIGYQVKNFSFSGHTVEGAELASPAWAESMPLPLSRPIREALGKKHLAIWTGVRLPNGSFLRDSLPRTDEREGLEQIFITPK